MIESSELPSAEVLFRLRSGCVRGLTPDMEQVLAARLCAGSSRGAAERLFLSERGFRERLAQVEDVILVPLGLPRDVGIAALWAGFHAGCCAKPMWELMESSAVFSAEMT